jgi:hypothetical protein
MMAMASVPNSCRDRSRLQATAAVCVVCPECPLMFPLDMIRSGLIPCPVGAAKEKAAERLPKTQETLNHRQRLWPNLRVWTSPVCHFGSRRITRGPHQNPKTFVPPEMAPARHSTSASLRCLVLPPTTCALMSSRSATAGASDERISALTVRSDASASASAKRTTLLTNVFSSAGLTRPSVSVSVRARYAFAAAEMRPRSPSACHSCRRNAALQLQCSSCSFKSALGRTRPHLLT